MFIVLKKIVSLQHQDFAIGTDMCRLVRLFLYLYMSKKQMVVTPCNGCNGYCRPIASLDSGKCNHFFLISKNAIMSIQKENYDFTELNKFFLYEDNPGDIVESLKYIHDKLIECVFYLLLTEKKENLNIEIDNEILEHLFELRSITEQLNRLAAQK
jgi:hypothetical protein